jgi:hypothetical protein
MSGLTPLVEVLHLLLLSGFVLVTFALLVVSVHNRLRVQNVVASWRPASWSAFPLGPILFALVVVGFEVISLFSGRTIPPSLLLGYGAGSLAWFVAAYLSSITVVSECGIVADIHRRDMCVAWGQISDYFEFERGRKRGFVFLFRNEKGDTRRLEIDVPRKLMPLLREHIDWRLQSRFESSPHVPTRGSRALDG